MNRFRFGYEAKGLQRRSSRVREIFAYLVGQEPHEAGEQVLGRARLEPEVDARPERAPKAPRHV